VVAVGGDADLTDFPCSRSPAARSSVLRRNPKAARSLLRKPPVRASWTCGASSGRRVMAPASLHNHHEAARRDPERCRTRPIQDPDCCWLQGLPGRFRRPTAAPTTRCRKHRRCRSTTRYRPCLSPRCRCNLQHHPDGASRRRGAANACRRAAGRAEFAPAHPIAGGSGGRSQRSLP